MKIALSKPWIGDEERAAIARVLDSGILVQGPEVAALEEEWARAVGAERAVATSSGSTALHLALLAHGVGPGDEVITTPFTFVATASAILQVGATPVFVDVSPDTFNLDPERVADAVTSRTRAILPVHIFGHPCDLPAIDEVARARNLIVIEDAAQAMGATIDGRPVGSSRATVCFSLYATKNVMSGEGGMITTSDPQVEEACRRLRSHGRLKKEEPTGLGFNFRLGELGAALGRAQLARLPEMQRRRRINASTLADRLADVVTTPVTRPGVEHAWHQFTVRVPSDRDGLAARLAAEGCASAAFYRTPAHRYPFVASRSVLKETPVVDRLAKEALSLPVHPLMSGEEVQGVAEKVRRLARP